MNKETEELIRRLRSFPENVLEGDGLCREAAAALERMQKDAERLDAIASEYFTLEPFDMPTGQGDANVGWRVLQHQMAERKPRVMAEVFEDDPRAAIDSAMQGEQQ